MPVYKEDNEKLLVKPTAMFFVKKIVLQNVKNNLKTVSRDVHMNET